jgi:glycosyltransferase involved in cell wall biosynthesis
MLPKVSCILPTGYGEKFVGTAVRCFKEQDYLGELELIVVDNNDEPWSDELVASLPSNVRYVRSKRMSVGALRNLGTANATGEICITWDEDDWYGSSRVSFQVNRLLETGMNVTGFHNLCYFDSRSGEAWKYFFEPMGNHHPYAPGGSQCYRRSWWERHKFEEHGIEDLPFTTAALHEGVLDSTDCGRMYVARIHGTNVVPKQLMGRQWQRIDVAELPKEFVCAEQRRGEPR